MELRTGLEWRNRLAAPRRLDVAITLFGDSALVLS